MPTPPPALPPLEAFIKNPFKGNVITLDPGETTGFAKWHDGKLLDCGQLPTHTVAESVPILDRMFWVNVDYVIAEEYRVYSWKTQSHAWETLHTPRLIGAIETLCVLHKIPYYLQGTQVVKQFATDDKLKGWGIWPTGKRHAADAIRHGVYWYCFGKPTI